MNDIIKSFWKSSWDNSIERYDFNPLFDMFRTALEAKLALHGQLTYEDYVKHISKYYDLSKLKEFEYRGTHTKALFEYESILEALFRPRYEWFHESFKNDSTYQNLLSLYEELRATPFTDVTQNILLADKCIHAQHLSGNIVPFDMEQLRHEMEFLSLDKAFGILTRPALELRLRKATYPLKAIFLDVVGLHELNSQYGYEVVNSMIRNVFQSLQETHSILIGRWFNGDEILIVPNNSLLCIDIARRLEQKHAQVSFRYTIINANNFEEIKIPSLRIGSDAI